MRYLYRSLVPFLVAFLMAAVPAYATNYTNSFTTTGSITSTTKSLVVASATGMAVGAQIKVAGAGAAAADLNTTIDLISGTTVTLHVAAGTTVVAAVVTGSTGQQSPGQIPELTPGTPVSTTNPLPVTLSGSGGGTIDIDQTTPGTTNGVNIHPTSSAGAGVTPVVSAAAEATHVLKASAGNLYSVYATNLTATAGFLQVFNATSAPVDGAVTPVECVSLPANGTSAITFNSGPFEPYSTGISVAVSSATTCFTKTTGVITALIHGAVQ